MIEEKVVAGEQGLKFFKMRLNCSKCNGDEDDDARKLKRRVRRKLGLSEGFKIFNSQGYPIQEDELSYLNQDGSKSNVIYVTAQTQSQSFDYEAYLRMFSTHSKLGEGGFGSVFLGEHLITKKRYAIKFIYPTVFKADEASKAFKEAQVLQTLKHQSIIKLHSVFQLPDTRIVLLMEYLEGGSLKEYLDYKGGRMTEKEAQKVMSDVGNALNYCHQRRIVHRDIKLENIMLRERENLERGLVIIDFGIAGKLQNQKEKHEEGTVRYAPPELMSGQCYQADEAFDVWSIGILLFKMVYGKFPFEGQTFNDIKSSIISEPLKIPFHNEFNGVSDTCQAMIKLMLNKDRRRRPKLNQLIQHEWFNSTKQHALMHSTFYQQSTLMKFFTNEMKIISESKQRQQESIIQKKSTKEVLETQNSYLSLPWNQKSNLESKGVFVKRKLKLKSPSHFISSREQPLIGALIKVEMQTGPSDQNSSLSFKKQQLSGLRSFLKEDFDSLQTRSHKRSDFKISPLLVHGEKECLKENASQKPTQFKKKHLDKQSQNVMRLGSISQKESNNELTPSFGPQNSFKAIQLSSNKITNNKKQSLKQKGHPNPQNCKPSFEYRNQRSSDFREDLSLRFRENSFELPAIESPNRSIVPFESEKTFDTAKQQTFQDNSYSQQGSPMRKQKQVSSYKISIYSGKISQMGTIKDHSRGNSNLNENQTALAGQASNFSGAFQFKKLKHVLHKRQSQLEKQISLKLNTDETSPRQKIRRDSKMKALTESKQSYLTLMNELTQI